MELRQLRYLMVIAEEGNFSRAADKLFVTQSALSQQVLKLEAEVEGPLLDRTNRHTRLTAIGEVLAAHARRIFAELDAAQVEIREMQGLRRGSLRVGTVQTVNAVLMPRVVAAFTAAYPQIDLFIEELAAGEIEAGLQNGSLQVGIGFAPATQPDIDAEALFTEELVLVVGPNHPLAHRSALDLADVAALPLAMLPKRFCTRRLVEDYAHEIGITPQVRIEMNTIAALLTTVEKTEVATILPQLALPNDETNLCSIHLVNPTPTRVVGTLWLHNSYRCEASRAFAELFKSQIATQQVDP